MKLELARLFVHNRVTRAAAPKQPTRSIKQGLCFLRAPCTSNWQRWNDDRWWKQNRSLEAWNLGDMVGCKPQVTGRFIKYRTNEVRHLHPSHRAKCDLSFLNGAFALLLSTIHITVSQARPVLQPYLHQSTPPIGPRQF